MLDETEPEECVSEPEPVESDGYTNIDGSVLVSNKGNWSITSASPYSTGLPNSSERETPDEVLGDHLNYLRGRKADYEQGLGELTQQYALAEEKLNKVQVNIESTEKAINQLKETTNK